MRNNHGQLALATKLRAVGAGVGRQVVLDLYGCSTEHLDDVDWVRETMLEAARVAEATIIESVFHKFSPWGISGVVVIAESHLAIHIWPEHRYAAVDVFTCGDTMRLDRAAAYLAQAFGTRDTRTHSIERGTNIQ
jgi:S-adenosylmethionine decarboxylase proenzyme